MGAQDLNLVVKPHEFFREKVSAAMANQKVEVDDDVEFYVVNLLCEFIDPAKLQTCFGDVDVNGHANYLSYIEWLLEVIPPSLRDEGQIAELEIHFLREINFGEELSSAAERYGEAVLFSIDGQGAGNKGKQFLHSLTRKHDGTELVRARTVWTTITA